MLCESCQHLIKYVDPLEQAQNLYICEARLASRDSFGISIVYEVSAFNSKDCAYYENEEVDG